ncbi:nitroreductase [Mitsuokella jalaludinii]|uniref:nitroreductase n=1 Tax=Mitsuokella jalaludinii TaxID=187979 RepID=UPI00266D59F7|nr:nitroreductase [Mitsuokella jalaludinii]MDY5365683.1 nitroreductase [Mitsuokella jalaludinii]MEE0481053.1 nitroreductase [Mitsuokella jalaludinii]
MDVFSCIATRHSTRKFKEEPVPQEVLDKVIEAGRQAPSGKHKNQSRFIVIRKKEVLQELIALVQQEFAKMEVTPENDDNFGGAIRAAKKGGYVFMYNAPVLIVVANKRDYGNKYADVSCAMQNMMLAANALDLGSCWINQLRWLQDNPVLRAYLQKLGMAEDEEVCASLSIGYPDTPDGLPGRRVMLVTGNPVVYID